MLILISPAKTLDFDTPAKTKINTMPDYLSDSQELIDGLQKLSAKKISSLMDISDKLSELNHDRFQTWQRPFTADNAKQAILAFQGDVYLGLEAETFSAADFKFAQQHLRILSGLYGLLRPLDLMQPYRLEMGTLFKNNRGKDLYAFWGDKITNEINKVIEQDKSPTIINLASIEYFKSVQPKLLKAEVITPHFKDYKNGQYKMISFFAKKARGMMTAYIIKNRLTKVEDLKDFDTAGYKFSGKDSTEKELVFLRKEQ